MAMTVYEQHVREQKYRNDVPQGVYRTGDTVVKTDRFASQEDCENNVTYIDAGTVCDEPGLGTVTSTSILWEDAGEVCDLNYMLRSAEKKVVGGIATGEIRLGAITRPYPSCKCGFPQNYYTDWIVSENFLSDYITEDGKYYVKYSERKYEVDCCTVNGCSFNTGTVRKGAQIPDIIITGITSEPIYRWYAQTSQINCDFLCDGGNAYYYKYSDDHTNDMGLTWVANETRLTEKNGLWVENFGPCVKTDDVRLMVMGDSSTSSYKIMSRWNRTDYSYITNSGWIYPSAWSQRNTSTTDGPMTNINLSNTQNIYCKLWFTSLNPYTGGQIQSFQGTASRYTTSIIYARVMPGINATTLSNMFNYAYKMTDLIFDGVDLTDIETSNMFGYQTPRSIQCTVHVNGCNQTTIDKINAAIAQLSSSVQSYFTVTTDAGTTLNDSIWE